MKLKLIIVNILCLAHAITFSQSNEITISKIEINKIDSLIRQYCNIDDFSGVVLLAKNQNIVYHTAVGKAERKFKVDNAIDTKFSIGSMTKAFTGYVIFHLVNEGQINPDTSINTYYKNLPEDVGEVTIHQILGHISGVWHYHKYEHYRGDIFPKSFAKEKFIEIFVKDGLKRPPGEERSYSSIGYYLLGMIAEEVTKKSLSDLYKEIIFDPLHMKNTHLSEDGIIYDKHASGYRYDIFRGYMPERYRHPSTSYAGGGLISNAPDLLKWSNFLIQLYKKDPESLYFKPIRDSKNREGFEGYSYGISTYLPMPKDSLTAFWHEGQLGGNRTMITSLPNENLSIIVLANTRGAPVMPITKNIIEILRNNTIPYHIRQPYISLMWDELSNNNLKGSIEIYEDLKIVSNKRFDFKNNYELVYLGEYLINEGRDSDGIAILTLASNDYPEDVNSKIAIAKFYINTNKKETAKFWLNSVLEINRNNKEANKLLKSLSVN